MKLPSRLVLFPLTAVSGYGIQPAGPAHSRANTSDISIRYPPPSIRHAPNGYNGHNYGAWAPPPEDYLTDVYHITYTSHTSWVAQFVNLRVERWPADSFEGRNPFSHKDELPKASMSDLTSWSACANATARNCEDGNALKTVFGHDIPTGAMGPTDKTYAAAWNFSAAGELEGKVGRLQCVIAWGNDADDKQYMLEYHAPGPERAWGGGGFNIVSRDMNGPSNSTVLRLINGLLQMGNELEDQDFVDIAMKISALTHDGRRGGGEEGCKRDAACVNEGGLRVCCARRHKTP